MKSIQNQYRDLREGKMSQQNFMRNLRMTMPQYITNVTSFRDAVKILTNKRILSESYGYSEEDYDTLLNTILKHVKDPKEAEMYASNPTLMPDWLKANLEQDSKKQDMPGFEGTLDALNNLEEENLNEGGDYNAIIPALKAKGITYGMSESEIIGAIAEVMEELGFSPKEISYSLSYDEDFIPDLLQDLKNSGGKEDDAEFDAMIKAAEDEKAGEEAVNAQYDIYEAKKPKKKEEKIEYSEHSCSPTELRLGIKTELENENVSELDKAKEIALKNIHKDPVYYTKLKLSGLNAQPKVKDIKAEPAKKVKKETPQLVDLVNGMQKVKIPKADDKGKKINMNEGVDLDWLPKGWSKDLYTDGDRYFDENGEERTSEEYKEEWYKHHLSMKEARFNVIGEPNEVAKQVMQFIDGNATLRALSDDLEIQQTSDPNEALLRFQYWDALPGEAIEKLKLQFDVQSDSDFDEDTGNIIFYRLTPLRRNYGSKDLGASFEKFKSSLEEIIREVVDETFDGRDNLINPLSAEDENN